MFAEKSFLCQARISNSKLPGLRPARMYHQYFGLSESPFSISVNPRYLFMSPRHRDALAHLLYGVGSGGGFILLTGEVGTGKTTINRCLLEQLPDTTDLAVVLNPALSAVELLATVCDEFGIKYPAGTDSLKVLTDGLHQFLLSNHAAGRKSVLLIDEAQHLDFEVLEQIRLLTNLETNEQKLLQIILIGQPELSAKLARSELRQLNQRITARYDLQALNEAETRAYVQHRLQVAGLPPSQQLFANSVVREVHRLSHGIPRRINVLCERILLGAYGQQSQTISKALVRSAASEVFGDDYSRSLGGRRIGLIAVAAVLVAVVAVLFAIEHFRPWGRSEVLTQASPSTRSLDAIESKPRSKDAALPQPAAGALTQEDATLMSLRGDAELPYLLEPTLAGDWFWRIHSDVAPQADGCPQMSARPLLCERGKARVWNDLARLERPIMLSMETPARFEAAVIVVEFSDVEAKIMTPQGIMTVALRSLARSWNGGYSYLWLPPDGWLAPLSEGNEAQAVAEVAQLFAELDGQSEPLADTIFNSQLAQRARFFQERQGLEVSGVVDVKTLLALRRETGKEPDSHDWLARARSLIERY